MKNIHIQVDPAGNPKVSFSISPDEKLKVVTRLEFKRLKRALDAAYRDHERSFKLASWNQPQVQL